MNQIYDDNDEHDKEFRDGLGDLIVEALADYEWNDDFGDEVPVISGQSLIPATTQPLTVDAVRPREALGLPRTSIRRMVGHAAAACTMVLVGVVGMAGYEAVKDSRTHLKNFEEVVENAAKIVNKKDGEVYIVVDVPAYGDASCPKEFPAYRAAFANRMNSKVANATNIVWYSDDDEQKYIKHESQSIDPQLLKNSRAIRRIVEGTAQVKHAPYEQFHKFQFWVWKGNEGSFQSVVAYVDKASLKAEVRGYTSTSPELAEFLISLFESVPK